MLILDLKEYKLNYTFVYLLEWVGELVEMENILWSSFGKLATMFVDRLVI